MEPEPSLTIRDSNEILSQISEKYSITRNLSIELCKPLNTEDYVVQPVVDVSPPKWHLAHTTWFFEELILKKQHGYKVFHPDFSYFFNSYYESVGKRVLRPNRGLMTRPPLEEIFLYREYVDRHVIEFLKNGPDSDELAIIELGINHEQQHQELLLTDIKYILGHNPLFPVYKEQEEIIDPDLTSSWLNVEGGIYVIGHQDNKFSYDNERSPHKVFIQPFRAMDRLVTAGEYLEFIEDGGYDEFRWWLSDGWDWVKQLDEKAPMYWHKVDGKWHHYTLHGFERINPNEPVTHISYYEADAYSHWKQKRLLNEFEWEVLANSHGVATTEGFVDGGAYHPGTQKNGNNQLMGYGWEWTQSAYLPYPGFKIEDGAVGEYNGKFMINQMVLRGGSIATSLNHIRTTYRNFFHPHLRWQFTGLRLAESN